METKYCILNTDDLHFVDYDKIMQTSYASLRFSPDKEKFIIKYKGDQPEFLFEIAGNDIGLKEYTKHEIIEIINTPEWKTESYILMGSKLD